MYTHRILSHTQNNIHVFYCDGANAQKLFENKKSEVEKCNVMRFAWDKNAKTNKKNPHTKLRHPGIRFSYAK